MDRNQFWSNFALRNRLNSSKSSTQKKKRDSPKQWLPYMSQMDRPRTFSHEVENEIPHDNFDDEVLLGSLRGVIVDIQYYKGNVNDKEMVSLCREPCNRYDRNAIRVDNVDGEKVGHIMTEQAIPLSHILDKGLGRIEGVVLFGDNNMYCISIDLTIWGKPEKRDEVLQFLRSHCIPVKQSLAVSTSSSSESAPLQLDYSHVITTRVLLSPANVQNELDKLFETLPEGDKTTMAEKATAIKTPLFPHQKQALNWMISRENGHRLPPFWEERSNGTYYNSLTIFTSNRRPSSVLGGILADDMGLGKTLEMIALILTNFVENKPLAVPVPGIFREQRREKSSKKTNKNNSSDGNKNHECVNFETKMAALEYSLTADFPEQNKEPPLPMLRMPFPRLPSDPFLCSLSGFNNIEDVIIVSDSSDPSDEDVQIVQVTFGRKDYYPKSQSMSASCVTRPTRGKRPASYNFSGSDSSSLDEENEKNPKKKVRTDDPSVPPVQNGMGKGKVCNRGRRKGIVKGKALQSKHKAPATVEIPIEMVIVVEDDEDDPDYLPDEKSQTKMVQAVGDDEDDPEHLPDEKTQTKMVQVVGDDEDDPEHLPDEKTQTKMVQVVGDDEDDPDHLPDEKTQTKMVQVVGDDEDDPEHLPDEKTQTKMVQVVGDDEDDPDHLPDEKTQTKMVQVVGDDEDDPDHLPDEKTQTKMVQVVGDDEDDPDHLPDEKTQTKMVQVVGDDEDDPDHLPDEKTQTKMVQVVGDDEDDPDHLPDEKTQTKMVQVVGDDEDDPEHLPDEKTQTKMVQVVGDDEDDPEHLPDEKTQTKMVQVVGDDEDDPDHLPDEKTQTKMVQVVGDDEDDPEHLPDEKTQTKMVQVVGDDEDDPDHLPDEKTQTKMVQVVGDDEDDPDHLPDEKSQTKMVQVVGDDEDDPDHLPDEKTQTKMVQVVGDDEDDPDHLPDEKTQTKMVQAVGDDEDDPDHLPDEKSQTKMVQVVGDDEDDPDHLPDEKRQTKMVQVVGDDEDDPDYLHDICGSQITSQSVVGNRAHSGSQSSDDDLDLEPVLLQCNEANMSNCDVLTGRSKCTGPRGTLIICPLSVMNNWLTQLNEHVHPNVHLEIYLYYGSNRVRDSKVLSQQDIVLTTYSTVASDFKGIAPLRTVEWLRIVLDEGHMIRNPSALQTKAVMELKAERKWVLTGTPIQNSMKDLWSLINFLNISPLTDKQWWHRTIERPLSHGDKSAIKRVQHLMDNIAMRRTKTQMVNGRPLINLPDKIIAIEHVKLSKEERDIYTNMQNEGKIIISRYFQQGTLLQHYGQVLAILMRLRQQCCHPLLVAKVAAAVANDMTIAMETVPGDDLDIERRKDLVTSLLEVLYSGSDEECSICLESLTFPVITSCAHVFCRPCIIAVIKNEKPNPKCPLCRTTITEDDLLDVPPEGLVNSADEPVVTTSNWQSSAKVDALMKSLVKLREEDVGIKSIVVSQFTSLLTILEVPLKLNGFSFARLDGEMTARARVKAIEEFMDVSPNSPTIFLLSLKAGGVGINLTAASRVFLMDPAWNPACEEQCFDRCHRLGQKRNVIITKFLVEDSVEERMMELQESKRQFKNKQTTEQRRAQRIKDIKTLINL